ncbi:MAG: prolyl oligopeptidase family serine peptidase [Candidatus Heimdallarchaeota archaeon]|nr:prolyl oligopeptidase family serine peptidase [Candidatus Heimdallarchaeota archaeon]
MSGTDSKFSFPIESLLSARQLLEPQLSDDLIYFISNMSGMYSLYKMKIDGSIPLPLLPEGLALQNPHLINGQNFDLFPNLNKILVMIDKNGDELYQPCFIPMDGGIPELIFGDQFRGMQVIYFYGDPSNNQIYLGVDTRKEPGYELYTVNLADKVLKSLGKTPYGRFLTGISSDHTKVLHAEGYGPSDVCIYYLDQKTGEDKVLIGTPITQRKPGETYAKTGIDTLEFVENDTVVVFGSIFDDDMGAINWKFLTGDDKVNSLEIRDLNLKIKSQLEGFHKLEGNQFSLQYNVNGETYYYLADYVVENETRYLQVTNHIIGNRNGPLHNGVKLSIAYDKAKAKEIGKVTEFITSYTKATMPSQLVLINTDIKGWDLDISYKQLSEERILGIEEKYLSEGEDSTYTSFDGLTIPSRLYLPSPNLNLSGPYPLVLWIHGGPQGQEVPDFTWFSMPLIQYLTLNGFAVSVPNVRGSTGYGTEYMAKVEKDWGGDDLKDHLEGLKVLEKDERIDSNNRFLSGRSYGGFMTLSLISRHPELWRGGADLFGPYDLIGFYNRLPPSWQTFFDLTLADPKTEEGQAFMKERSPKTYFDNITAPLLIIQGANDPRVTLEESKEIFEYMKSKGKEVELLAFDDEGHDVIKFNNKVVCYTRIVDFFKANLSS